MERVKRIGSTPRWEAESKVLVPLAAESGELKAYADADWGGDIMRGGHRLKVWTKKQQVVSLSTAESEPHLDAPATMGLVNRRGLGKAKHVDMQNLRVQEEEGRHEREPSRLSDETDAEIENRAAHQRHGLRVHENRDKTC